MKPWTSEQIRTLRLRLGWSAADFARRFGGQAELILQWEAGTAAPTAEDRLQFEQLAFHIDSYSDHVSTQPLAEKALITAGVEQIHHDRVRELSRNQ